MLGFWFAEPAPATAPPAPRGSSHHSIDAGTGDHFVITVLLPIAISVLLHVGMLLCATFIYWTVQDTGKENEEVIIPIARLSETPGAALTMRQSGPTASQDMATAARRTVSPTAMTNATSLSSKVNTSSSLAGVGGAEGTGTGSGGGSGGAGGAGWGGGSGGAGGGGGKGNPFGAVISAGANLKATFYGTGGNAKKLVYLVDASGSLIDVLPFVITELKRSMNDLSEKQSFTIIFFQGDDFIEVPPTKMKTANAETKQKVLQWLDGSNVVPAGLANPVKAVKQALQYKPDLLFILSDNITGSGRYEVDQRRLLAEIERANVNGTKINTIQFLYKDKLESVLGKSTLELIADRSGGNYKFLSEVELGIK